MMQTAWRKSSRSAANDNCVEARATAWRKSSRSGGGGQADNCVEARGISWRKSSSSAPNDNCVEARGIADGFEVRDSKLGDDSPAFGLGAADFLGLLKAASRA